MNTSHSRTTPPPKPIDADETIRGLTSGVVSSDAARAEGYGQLGTVRAAKQNQLARRESLLAVKYGADHPRVAEVKTQQTVNRMLIQQVEVIRVQTANPPPQVDAQGYVFHGYVRNRQRQPKPGLTVALFDEKGWFKDLGYGCSDENGYFILRYNGTQKMGTDGTPGANDPGKGNDPGKTPPPAPPPASGGQTPGVTVPGRDKAADDQTTGGTTRDENSKSFEIRVYNSEQKLIYRDPTPLVAHIGNVDFRELIIDDDDCNCTPPPGGKDDLPPPAPRNPVTGPRAPVTNPSKPPAVDLRPPSATPAPQPTSSTPLENIRGVGPKTATKLRAKGIKDIEGLEQVDTKKLVDFAGLDKSVTQPKKTSKPAAARKPKK